MPFYKGHPPYTQLKLKRGQRFNRLVILSFVGSEKGTSRWECKCDCGKVVVMAGTRMKDGSARSCGCLKIERVSKTHRTHGMSRIGGAGSKHTPFYSRWSAMIQRCENKNALGYRHWGGRGIIVCSRWHDFRNFKSDMYPSFLRHVRKHGRENTSIDRIDNERGYLPSNCRWATRVQQNSHTRRNTIIEFQGRRLTMSEWARRLGLDRATVYYRVFRARWPLHKALTHATSR